MRTYQATLAIQRFDRTEALHDGRVSIERVMTCQALPGVSVKGLLDGTFEAAEMPLAHYVFLRDQGDPFTAIPVFPDRVFLERYLLTTRDSGISSIADTPSGIVMRGSRSGAVVTQPTSPASRPVSSCSIPRCQIDEVM